MRDPGDSTSSGCLATSAQDYGEALKAHYAASPPADWQDAVRQRLREDAPWEDFAETWAHYLHIVDTLETAALRDAGRPARGQGPAISPRIDFDPYTARDFEPIIDGLASAHVRGQHLNRSMGHPDLYPFVLSAPVIEKLGYIHRLVRQGRTS